MGQKYSLNDIWSQEVMGASIGWFGKMDLSSCLESIDRLNKGEIPESKTIKIFVDQPDYSYPDSYLEEAYT